MRPAILAFAGATGVAVAEVGLGAGWVSAALAIAASMFGHPRAAVVALAACAGAVLAARDQADRAASRAAIAPAVGVEGELSGRVLGPVERERGALRFVLDAPVGARVLVSLRHDGVAPDLLPGDRIRVRGRLRWPRGYRVPGAADAERRAAARGVVALLGADASRAEWTRGDDLEPWRMAGRLQRRLADRISDQVGEGGEALRALVTGDRGAMSDQEAARWRESGASSRSP